MGDINMSTKVDEFLDVLNDIDDDEEIFTFINQMVVAMIMLITLLVEGPMKECVQGCQRVSRLISETRRDLINRMINYSDIICIEQLRMDRRTLDMLCTMLRVGGLTDTRNVLVEEMVIFFLRVIGHNHKNRVVNFQLLRSGETISRTFNKVLNSVICLHGKLFKSPEAVSESCTDPKWKWFKNCLGAIDGTHINVRVSDIDKPRYRNRKEEITTNVLGVCSQDMQFIYVLPGWEGSAADSRVLRDAISRRNGLKVPHGYYYLADAGYPISEGFLTPYRGQRYHLNDWKEGYMPTNHEEFFNMKHSSARNVIERCFRLLKICWGILRDRSFYPIKTQIRIITACCLIHNLIRREMPNDPILHELDRPENNHYVQPPSTDSISYVDTSNQWSNWRKELAQQMFIEWSMARTRR